MEEPKEINMVNCYSNRELSWLRFNERVLEEADSKENPLGERTNFISIFQSNLDEFFMVRVGSLYDLMMFSGNPRENKTNMTAQEQVLAVFERVRELSEVRDRIYDKIVSDLKEQGIKLLGMDELTVEEYDFAKLYFERELKPLLAPQVVGKKQPFPFLRNKEIYLLLSLETKNNNEKIGIIPCSSPVFGRLVSVGDNKYILTEELIKCFADIVFDRYIIREKSLIRVTRNADIDEDEGLYDDDVDYRRAMEEIIKKRKKLSPVRLEMSDDMSPSIISSLCKYLDIKKNQIFNVRIPLDVSFLRKLPEKLNDKSMYYEPRRPQESPFVNKKRSMIDQIKEKDLLLAYPFESMKPFLRLLHEAAEDPEVIAIRMTLYRVAKYSKVVEALIEAAENGKDVIVLVELRARFDEENNIEWSKRLEEAGCRIIYGLDGLKVHSKLCLITRKSDNRIEYITQIGTGNYNENTAKLYTDFSLMTASVDIGVEANEIFNELAMGKAVKQTKYLLAAPNCLQNKIISMIDDEIKIANRGQKAYIGVKINSLTDKKIIDKLIEASQAGVEIEMIVRGICCLKPGIKGYTDNIKIISIVGRFLEHSRIYIFGTEDRAKVYISSADYMTRNTLRRVEIAVPIYDEDIKVRILEMFSVMMSDNVKARIQNPDGTYTKRSNIEPNEEEETMNSQEYFYQQAYNNSGAANQAL
ncbi:MAG: polyphosphate kinase 1 [Monoglobales bacterium]